MMHNDSGAILDDILSRWHAHCRAYKVTPVCGADPMFRMAKSSRHHMSEEEVVDGDLHKTTMKAVDFHVGELQEPHRTAIYINARNCYTGRSVWFSPRLPENKAEREVILLEARNLLMRRLLSAGVL